MEVKLKKSYQKRTNTKLLTTGTVMQEAVHPK
jgi:hypothetical protein